MEANVVETSSHTKVEVVKVSHTWTISNFSYCVKKTGQALISETFSAGADDEANSCLKRYPRGANAENKDYVSIFVRLQSWDKPLIEAKIRIAIYNDMMGELRKFSLDQVWNTGKQEWGFNKFVTRNFLFDNKNKLLSYDKLTIFCEVGVPRDTVSVAKKSVSLKLKDPASSLLADLELLMDTQKFSNVTLIAGGQEFRAHKTILAARSAVFSAMFEHEMEEQKYNRVDIIDIDEKVVEEMLRFICTSEVPNIKKIADSLLVAADKYALDSLKLMCQESLAGSLAIENAAHVLVLAHIHSCDWLKTQAINFITKYTTPVMDTADFKLAVTSHPHLVAEILRAKTIKADDIID